jgi:hypothetical protein
MPVTGYDGVTVFSSTVLQSRRTLGEKITAWLSAHPDRLPVCTVVQQSSAAAFHCLSILVFWQLTARA